MSDIELYLIRHTEAEEASGKGDAARQLTARGRAQAEQLLAVLGSLKQFDHLYSSPLTRAAQTAEPLAQLLRRSGGVQYLDSLAGDAYDQLITDIRERIQDGAQTVGLVGHEPYLGRLASYLLTGDSAKVPIDIKKGAFATLNGTLAPAGMTLRMLVPQPIYAPAASA